MLPKKISVASRANRAKSRLTLERWSRALDVFYVRDFGLLLVTLNSMDIDSSDLQHALRDKDWQRLTELQIEFLKDWSDELIDQKADIPRCAVYFMSAMERKDMDTSRYGDCDRHVVNLTMYELIVSCVYRQINLYDLWSDDVLVEKIMALHAQHQAWFQWQTDVQRMIIWTRRKEYENTIAYRPFLLWKVERLECQKCKTRYSRLISRMRQQFQIVSAYGKPFNAENFYGQLENQPEYEEIMYLRKIRG